MQKQRPHELSVALTADSAQIRLDLRLSHQDLAEKCPLPMSHSNMVLNATASAPSVCSRMSLGRRRCAQLAASLLACWLARVGQVRVQLRQHRAHAPSEVALHEHGSTELPRSLNALRETTMPRKRKDNTHIKIKQQRNADKKNRRPPSIPEQRSDFKIHARVWLPNVEAFFCPQMLSPLA